MKDSANSASYYDVDVVDAENPPAPIAQPANSISITSCGAVADNAPTNGSADPAAQDSTGAIQNCINQAQSQNKTLWIPQGTFYLKGTTGLQATGITIAGAGMWYSTIYRDVPLPNSQPLAAVFSVTSCTVQNFHIDSDATSRGTVGGDGGAMDTTGTNWVADGMWNQHTESGFWASGTGGTVKNSRVTSEWADGINLNNVSLTGTVGNNLTATNNFVRGTGDDAMAINSVAYNGSTTYTPMSNVTLTNNTLIAPWGGKGIGIYGGSGHHVQNNYISDTARYIGLGAGRFGVNGSDLHGATVSGNMVVRSGGDAYNQGQPAFHIGNGGDGQNTGVVDSVNATGNTILNSLYDGVGFSQSTNSTFAEQHHHLAVAQRHRDPAAVLPGADRLGVDHRQHGLRPRRRPAALPQQLQRLHRDAQRQQLAGRRRHAAASGGPVRRHPGRDPRHAPGGELRHRRRRRRLPRDLHQRQRQLLPRRRRGPGSHLRHRRRLRPRLDLRRPVVPVHGQRRHRRDLHDEPARGGAIGGHRSAAPVERLRRQPVRRGEHPGRPAAGRPGPRSRRTSRCRPDSRC